jgi:hypothetical protein
VTTTTTKKKKKKKKKKVDIQIKIKIKIKSKSNQNQIKFKMHCFLIYIPFSILGLSRGAARIVPGLGLVKEPSLAGALCGLVDLLHRQHLALVRERNENERRARDNVAPALARRLGD